MEWCPTHPKAARGVYWQHRLVMECALGRFLTAHERVHHRNHDRADNRIDNLELAHSHSQHMRQHWAGRGKHDQKLIEQVRTAAKDPTRNISSVGISPTLVKTICREQGIEWVPSGQRGIARLLTEQSVRAALQGRATIQAAQHLGVNVATLYNRFGHLLTKRTKPGALDAHRAEILQMVYRDRVSRSDVARRFSVSERCVTKSIQRWSTQGATLDGAALPPPPRSRPGPRPGRKARDRAARSPSRASTPPRSPRTRQPRFVQSA